MRYEGMVMKRFLAIITIASVLGACASGGGRSAVANANEAFAQLAAEVEREIRATEKTGFLWRDTEQLLQDARSAQAESRYEDAKQLANKALRQAKMAQQQARENANAGPVYPKP
jgi:hypothetical protein